MAGGKETPRQKLIGLMYLVLLALLALQVSSSIMEKFKFLDDSLQAANGAAEEKNTNVEKAIEKAVEKDGGKDKYVVDLAKEVRDEGEKIKVHIDKLREDLISTTGGYTEGHGGSKMWAGAKAETEVEIMMIGAEGSKSGKGYVLQKEINAYSARLNEIFARVPSKVMPSKPKFDKIAKDPKEDPRITEHEAKEKDFAQMNFGQTPMCAAMAVLSNIEAEVMNQETVALANLQQLVGATNIQFDQISAQYSAESKVVANGTKYKAVLFLSATSSAVTPTMKLNGSTIKVAKGYGEVEIMARATNFDKDGLSKQTWSGSITINNKGTDTTFTVKGEYTVSRPVIQVQAGSISALYEGCPNTLSIQVPALGATYAPSFAAENGSVQSGIDANDKGKVAVTPNDGTAKKAKVKIKVSSGGNYIGDAQFEVRKVPLPVIKIKINGVLFDGKTPIKASASNVSLVFEADETFKTTVGAAEASFKPEDWVIMVAKGKRAVLQNSVGAASTFMVADPSRGDRIVLEIKKIKRAGKKTIEMTANNIFIVPIDSGK
ncbi:MAG: gliding motility-related protein [Bacteroidota bacterium]|jgi:gliding motility-associated protein GldM